MGLEKTHGRNYDLSRILSGIHEGRIVLPEFQRDFQWDNGAVKQLLATCLTGWPIGSLLLLPGKSQFFFSVREIEGAPRASPPYQMVVLDGQQRLTSLYQALYGRGSFRYAIRLDVIADRETIEDLEEAIVAVPSKRWERYYGNPRREYEHNLLPVSALRSPSAFYAWRDEALEHEVRADSKRRITDLYVDFLSGLDRYEIPAVVIDDEVHPEAVARIFERVNRLGQALGTFDLMVAKSFTQHFNLRHRWETAQREHPGLAAYLEGDGLPVLSLIALRARHSVRQHDVLELPGTVVRDLWEPSVEAMSRAVIFAQQRLGVLDPDWMPFRVQLSILGGLALEGELDSHTSFVESWFWKSVFQGRYDVASNTRAVEDFQALLGGRDPLPDRIELDKELMLSVNKRQFGSLHRGLLCLLATAGPIDPVEGVPTAFFDASNIAAVSVLGRDVPQISSAHLLTLGMLLVGRQTAKAGIIDLDEFQPATLASHLIETPELLKNPAEFLEQRLERVARQLSSRAQVPVELMAAETD
ncbi:conserved hypothetical protein [Arthrobacter sp. 9AX]|uniref:GmrSD restriction endonuclease domain-containing protein n=1 Tax=Arthrobacter sp. 9AX TaxID=2653131 RepID=UPI0012F42915|nr:DUF262 domain-containing protein [Arthrobacter sp. 9AX]VXC53935.1 conserved hypothetical protein [Arthrobacter sp. 9AX]